jgi:hypothetical protein
MELKELPKEILAKLVKKLSMDIFTMDELWFKEVQNRDGVEVAFDFDVKTWGKFGGIDARRTARMLNLTEKGINGLSKVLPVCFLISEAREYEVEIGDKTLTYTVIDCKTQERWMKAGNKEMVCKPVGVAFWQEFATFLDLEVECLFCPPDKHPENAWCKWIFREED